MELGKAIQKRRHVLNMTVKELSRLTGLSEQWISAIESGTQTPGYEELQLLTARLGTSPAQLIGVEEGLAHKYLISDDEWRVLKAYRKASPEVRREVSRVVNI